MQIFVVFDCLCPYGMDCSTEQFDNPPVLAALTTKRQHCDGAPMGLYALYRVTIESFFSGVMVDSLVKSLFTRHCEEQSDEAIS